MKRVAGLGGIETQGVAIQPERQRECTGDGGCHETPPEAAEGVEEACGTRGTADRGVARCARRRGEREPCDRRRRTRTTGCCRDRREKLAGRSGGSGLLGRRER